MRLHDSALLSAAHYQVLTFVGCHSLNSLRSSLSLFAKVDKKKAVIKTLIFTPAEKKKQRSLSLLPQPVMCVLVHESAHVCVCVGY